jgi:putative membrane protein insertion efficiency factor
VFETLHQRHSGESRNPDELAVENGHARLDGERRWIPAFAGMTLRGSIFLYRHTLSLFLGRQCRYLPTCSDYADEAIRIHGPAKGSALAFRRVCRCHPWGGQGFDPVPLPPQR